MVRKGWTKMDVPDGPDHPRAMSKVRSVAKGGTTGGSEAHRFQATCDKRQASRVEGWENRGRHGIGAGAFGCPFVPRGVVEEGQGGGSPHPMCPAALQMCLLWKPTQRWPGSRDLWQLWAQTTPKKGEFWRKHCRRSEPAQQWHPWGSDWTSARNICEWAAKRLEKAQEVVTEALKVPAPNPPKMPGTDELAQLRSQVAQMEGELKLSHQAVSEKSMVESSLKRQVMSEGGILEGSCRVQGDKSLRNGTGPCGSSIRISFDVGSDRGSRQ